MLTITVSAGSIYAQDPVAGAIELGTIAEAGDLITAILAAVPGKVSIANLSGGGDGDSFFLEYAP